MAHGIEQQISFYHNSYFTDAASALSKADVDELERLTDSCCEMAGLYKAVKERN